jgi:hypothetical protein
MGALLFDKQVVKKYALRRDRGKAVYEKEKNMLLPGTLKRVIIIKGAVKCQYQKLRSHDLVETSVQLTKTSVWVLLQHAKHVALQ